MKVGEQGMLWSGDARRDRAQPGAPVSQTWQQHRVSQRLPEEDTGQSTRCSVNGVTCLRKEIRLQ